MERLTKNNPLFTTTLIPKGNGKLLDYLDPETGKSFLYAQFNTRAITDCPFRSKGCESICYATKGNHQFGVVKDSRSRSYEESKTENFSDKIIYTLVYHLHTKRYTGSVMIVRVHESGDFYSVQYLRKWVKIWKAFYKVDNVIFVLYTKSFPFFLMLTEEEKDVVRKMMENKQLSINLSIDDTTTKKQLIAYLEMIKEFPLCNTYRVTENYTDDDDKCDCANCAKCGACNNPTGKTKVVKIHSASKADKEIYRKNRRK